MRSAGKNYKDGIFPLGESEPFASRGIHGPPFPVAEVMATEHHPQSAPMSGRPPNCDPGADDPLSAPSQNWWPRSTTKLACWHTHRQWAAASRRA